MKAYVCAHRSMVGAAIVRRLAREQVEVVVRAPHELDLLDSAAVHQFFREERPEQVYLIGERRDSSPPTDAAGGAYIRDTLSIQLNVTHAAWESHVSRLLFLGSSCIYPARAPQPTPESALLTNPLDPAVAPWALAKIAGLKICESYEVQFGCDFRSIMPANIYGPGDLFCSDTGLVVAALMRKFHEAKLAGARSAPIRGSGAAMREFLYVDDLADACWFVMNQSRARYDQVTEPMQRHLNVAARQRVTVMELAEMVADVVGFTGAIEADSAGTETLRMKLLDGKRLQGLGWEASTDLQTGLRMTYAAFVDAPSWHAA